MFKGKKKKGEAAGEATEAADAPAAAEGAEGEAPAKKKFPLKILIFAAVGVLVLGGGGGGAAYIFLLKPKADAAGAHGPDEKGGHEKKAKPKKKESGGHGGGAEKGGEGAGVVREGPDGVVFYTLPDLAVNMQTSDGRPTYQKLKLTFELADHDVAETIDLNMPRIQDTFQTFLRELRPEDMTGSQGTYALRMEIQRRVNLVIAPAKVNTVLIEEQLIN